MHRMPRVPPRQLSQFRRPAQHVERPTQPQADIRAIHHRRVQPQAQIHPPAHQINLPTGINLAGRAGCNVAEQAVRSCGAKIVRIGDDPQRLPGTHSVDIGMVPSCTRAGGRLDGAPPRGRTAPPVRRGTSVTGDAPCGDSLRFSRSFWGP